MDINPYSLRAIREGKQRTVSALAKQADIGQAHLSNVELGRRKASDDLIVKLAECLDVHVQAIVIGRVAA